MEDRQLLMVSSLAFAILLVIAACSQSNTNADSLNLQKQIKTNSADLVLSYESGKAIFRGTMQRSVPCVNWTVQVITTRDFPVSHVNINIADSNKGAICIQMVGEPQEIYYEIADVSENTNYAVSIESNELFSGKLTEKGDEQQ